MNKLELQVLECLLIQPKLAPQHPGGNASLRFEQGTGLGDDIRELHMPLPLARLWQQQGKRLKHTAVF